MFSMYTNYYNNTRIDENLVSNKLSQGSKYIPKNIYQILTPDKNNINPSFQQNIDYIKNLNPNWTHTLFDENDIVKYLENNYPHSILEIYNSINPKYGAAKADFFRYLLMYKEGGAYFDIKSAMKYPLDQIIKYDDEYVLTRDKCQCKLLGNIEGEFQQWYIICKPRHPYLKSVIDNVIKNILEYDISKDGTGKAGVFKVTGPIVYTESILPILSNHNYTLYDQNEHIGIIYNNTNKLVHKSLLYSKHYSKLKEPIIL